MEALEHVGGGVSIPEPRAPARWSPFKFRHQIKPAMGDKRDAEKRVRFFNVSLVNATPMSLPKFAQPQRLLGELIHSIEVANPEFAWVQFLFKRVNLSHTLIALKNAMNISVEHIKTPKRSWIDDSESDRRELCGDWFKRSGERIKRIDAIANVPHVLLAIQGMWVGDPRQLSSLPFKDCYDEFDRLGTFLYRDPRMLVELVERRMVEDVSSYIMSYVRSRMEPPSFLITPDEIPYFLHLPVVKQDTFLKSVAWKQHTPGVDEGKVQGRESGPVAPSNPRIFRLKEIPLITEPLKEPDTERLSQLPSPSSVRGLELLSENGHTDLLLSSTSEGDLQEYLSVLESVYGKQQVVGFPEKPEFLKRLPEIVGLVRKPVPR